MLSTTTPVFCTPLYQYYSRFIHYHSPQFSFSFIYKFTSIRCLPLLFYQNSVNFTGDCQWISIPFIGDMAGAFDSCSILSYILFAWFPLFSTSLIFLLPHWSFLLRLLCYFHSSAILLILECPGLKPQSYSFLYLDSPFIDVIQSHSSKYYAWANDFQLNSSTLRLFPEFQVYLDYSNSRYI